MKKITSTIYFEDFCKPSKVSINNLLKHSLSQGVICFWSFEVVVQMIAHSQVGHDAHTHNARQVSDHVRPQQVAQLRSLIPAQNWTGSELRVDANLTQSKNISFH